MLEHVKITVMKEENRFFTLGCDFASSLIVGVLIGIGIDKYFGTKPWFLVIFFFLGSISGILNVIRTVKKFEK